MNDTPRLERLLTAKEVAALLTISTQSALRYARLGIIPSIRVGGQVRFSPNAVEEWAARGGTRR